ncbi:unnamed protein product [Rotaria magnacalcarata]|uniref:Uncharacterized protein n=2 Tax=Rotaria magnacalcarata TaxID=392030 RepID=A0A816R200_9BILA|nr:unnamed protein product [Rotaria magnacalcarata]
MHPLPFQRKSFRCVVFLLIVKFHFFYFLKNNVVNNAVQSPPTAPTIDSFRVYLLQQQRIQKQIQRIRTRDEKIEKLEQQISQLKQQTEQQRCEIGDLQRLVQSQYAETDRLQGLLQSQQNEIERLRQQNNILQGGIVLRQLDGDSPDRGGPTGRHAGPRRVRSRYVGCRLNGHGVDTRRLIGHGVGTRRLSGQHVGCLSRPSDGNGQ